MPAAVALPTVVSPAAVGAPPIGTVTKALLALALPPPSVAVTWHCRWWPLSWFLTVYVEEIASGIGIWSRSHA